MNKIRHILKNKDGVTIIILGFMIAAMLGFASIVVDVGMVIHTEAQLQNAADAAALAGARYLPDAEDAKSKAEDYATKNGASTVIPNTPYDGDSNKIEVECSKNVSYAFAKFLGLTQTSVSARAVAKKIHWNGEALPFINLDDDYDADPEVVAWEKTDSGDFESIDNYEIINSDDPNTCYFKVDYMNGVELKKGTVALVKQEVGYVYDQHYPDKPVYVLSISREVMESGQVKLIDGSYRSLSKLKNNDVIHPDQLVLLECIFHDYDYQGKTLYFTVLDVYDIANGEFPSSPSGNTALLVE